MAIANYSDLLALMDQYLGGDISSAYYPDFVLFSESRFNRLLRTRDMVNTDTQSLSNDAVALPSDYLEWFSVSYVGTTTYDLRYAEPDSEEWRFRYRPNSGPSMFTILAGNLQIRPSGSGDVTLYYYQTVPPLVSNNTNWLLTRAPDLYVYTALAEAHVWNMDENRAAQYFSLAFSEAEKLVQDSDSNKSGRRALRANSVEAFAQARSNQMGPP